MNKADGEFFDEDDLRERYKDKPGQLENLLQSAETMIHPTRKCTMYLDFALKKNAESGSSTSLEVKRKVTQEDNKFQKPPKAAKPKKGASGPSAKDSNAVEGHSLTDKQKAKLSTLKTNIQDELKKCDDMSAEIAGDTEFAEFLPEKVINNNNTYI